MGRFILITGRMASGKSKVSELLRKKHYKVIDMDSEFKKYYQEPASFRDVVYNLGPWVLNEEGMIDTYKLLSVVFTRNDENAKRWRNDIMQAVMWPLLDSLSHFYSDNNCKEVIFLEAALTPELGWCRNYLSIDTVIMVKADEKIRMERLQARKNSDLLMMLDKTQDEKCLNIYKTDLMPVQSLDPPDVLSVIENNGTEEDLNDRLMEVLEKELNITHEEKLATYIRYLKECPTYCHDNAWCYSFFNCGGCTNCPFPCANQDKYYKKLNEKFIAEQKKANSAEKKWNEYIDAWADEYNQAQKETKEYYVTRTSK